MTVRYTMEPAINAPGENILIEADSMMLVQAAFFDLSEERMGRTVEGTLPYKTPDGKWAILAKVR